MGDRGRVVLPSSLRRQLGLQPGDRLIVTVESDGTARLISATQLALSLQGLFSSAAPERSLSEELIAERRSEAEREGSPM